MGTIALVGGIAVHMPVEHVRVLLLRAKHLFVATISGGSSVIGGRTAGPWGVSTFQSRRYAPALPPAPIRRWPCAGHDGDAAMTAVLTTLSVLFALVFTAMLVTAAIRDARRLRAATMSAARRHQSFLGRLPRCAE